MILILIYCLNKALSRSPFPDFTKGDPQATPQDLRRNQAAHLAGLRHLYPIPGPIPQEVSEKECHVLARDRYPIRMRVYVPVRPVSKMHADGAGGRPLIAMLHEGSWSKGDLSDEDMNCRMFGRDLDVVCVNVEYRLAPEHPFPVGVNDCWDVLQWCARTAGPDSTVLPADPRKGFIVGGASAGGNFAAVMAQLARDEGLSPPLTGQYLAVPALLSADVVPEKWKLEYRSRKESVSDPVLRLAADGGSGPVDILKADTASPLYNPLVHPDLKNLPAAFFQVAGLDPLRDEALIYERVLREESQVSTKMNVYDGFGHMFVFRLLSLHVANPCAAVED